MFAMWAIMVVGMTAVCAFIAVALDKEGKRQQDTEAAKRRKLLETHVAREAKEEEAAAAEVKGEPEPSPIKKAATRGGERVVPASDCETWTEEELAVYLKEQNDRLKG